MREFTDDELAWQAHKLMTYVRNGGDPWVWLRSKDFGPSDRKRLFKFLRETDCDVRQHA